MNKINKHVQAILVDEGLIKLIDEDRILDFKQKGINELSTHELNKYIELGMLRKDIKEFETLPDGYEIYFEDEEIMGKAESNFKGVI